MIPRIFFPLRPARLLAAPLLAAIMLSGCELEDIVQDSHAYQEDFHFTYDMQSGGRLRLENFNGPVEVSGWDRDQVEIRGAKHASTREALAKIKIEIKRVSGGVEIRSVKPLDTRGGMGVAYTIRAPRKTLLDRVMSSNGGVRIDSIDSDATIRTSNGSILVTGLDGKLDGATSNGSIQIRGVSGGAVLHTSNASITASDVRGAFEAVSSNGGIHVEIDDPEAGRPMKLKTSNAAVELSLGRMAGNDIEAVTSNGGITVRMPSGASANLRAVTSHGTVSSQFQMRVTKQNSKGHLEGAIGGGGPRMELKTSNGSILLVKS